MPPTPEQTRAGYHNLWNRAKVRPENAAAVKAIAHKIIANKPKYQAVERATGVPWFMIGPIHNREASLRFNAHLHCGTPLTKRTTLVPKGRPKAPPANGVSYRWEESAIDALSMPPHDLSKVKNWSLERILYETEKYNGWGYLGKGNSPYLWAATTEYHGGKYVADHVYDRNAWDKQLGCVALLKSLADLDSGIAFRLSFRQETPPQDVIDEQVRNRTKTERNLRNGGLGTAGVGTGTKATVETPSAAQDPAGNVLLGALLPIAIFIALAVTVAAVIAIARKKKTVPADVAAKWS
jgi:lysozyme family protein